MIEVLASNVQEPIIQILAIIIIAGIWLSKPDSNY